MKSAVLFLMDSDYPDFKTYFAREILYFKFVYSEPYQEKTEVFYPTYCIQCSFVTRKVETENGRKCKSREISMVTSALILQFNQYLLITERCSHTEVSIMGFLSWEA